MIFPSSYICVSLLAIILDAVCARSTPDQWWRDPLRHEHSTAMVAHWEARNVRLDAGAMHMRAAREHSESASMSGTDRRAHRRAAKAHIKAAKRHEDQADIHKRKAKEHEKIVKFHDASGMSLSRVVRSRFEATQSTQDASHSHFYAKSTVGLLENAMHHDSAKMFSADAKDGEGHQDRARKDRGEALRLSPENGNRPSRAETEKKLEESNKEAEIAKHSLQQLIHSISGR